MPVHQFDAWGTERVLFGPNAFDSLGSEIARLGGERVFVIASATLERRAGLVAGLQRLLGARLAGTQIGMPQHMPRPEVVKVAQAANARGADLLLAVGGGSVVDAAKLVQLCLSADVKDERELDRFVTSVDASGRAVQPVVPAQRVRTVCIPTTLSGAEFTGRAGAVDPARRVKQIFVHRDLAPRTVLLDPLLTVHTPPEIWFASGMRAVDHAVESICSPQCNPYAEGLARTGLQLLSSGLRRAARDWSDTAARHDCQLGAWSAIGALQAGATMGASHGIGHALGAEGVLHGHTSCVMLAPVLRFNRPANEARQRVVAATLGDPDADPADLVDDMVRSLGLPRRLRDVGLARERLAHVAGAAMQDRWIHTNPRRIHGAADVLALLEDCW